MQQIPVAHHRRQQKDAPGTLQPAWNNSNIHTKDSKEGLRDVASVNGGGQKATEDLNYSKKNMAMNGSRTMEGKLLPPSGTTETDHPQKRTSQKRRKRRWWKKKQNKLKSMNSSLASAQSQQSVGKMTTAFKKEEGEFNKDIVVGQSTGGMQEGSTFADAKKKRRKRRRQRKRKLCQVDESSQCGGGLERSTDKVEEGIPPAKKMKTTEEKEPPAPEPSMEGNKQRQTKAQRRKGRRRKSKVEQKKIENCNNKAVNQVQNPTTMASGEPEKEERREKKKLNEISDSSVSVGESSDNKKEAIEVDLPVKKQETPEGSLHHQKGGDHGEEGEKPVKKKKRRKKRKRNRVDNPSVSVVEGKEGKEIEVNVPTKKLKESIEGNPVSQENRTTPSTGEKMHPSHLSKEEEEPSLTASQENKKEKDEQKQVTKSSSPNTASCPHTKELTVEGQQEASTKSSSANTANCPHTKALTVEGQQEASTKSSSPNTASCPHTKALTVEGQQDASTKSPLPNTPSCPHTKALTVEGQQEASTKSSSPNTASCPHTKALTVEGQQEASTNSSSPNTASCPHTKALTVEGQQEASTKSSSPNTASCPHTKALTVEGQQEASTKSSSPNTASCPHTKALTVEGQQEASTKSSSPNTASFPHAKALTVEGQQEASTKSSSPNTASCPHTKVLTVQGQQEASTSATNSQHSSPQTPILHSSFTSNDNMKKIASCWTKCSMEGTVLEEGKIEVIKNPFTCCYISHLLESEEYLEGVKKELDDIELLTKNNDLYKFQQTGDLRGVTTPFISGLRHLLYTNMRQWLISVTGIPLSDTVDMGSSRYAYTDVLLCHDDELEGRRIAYVLYLVPPWGPEDGGSLDLFCVDKHGHPRDIVRSLTPKNNAFAFFEVSPVSFHQVSEVLSRDKTRLSINGWFHGPPIPRLQRKLSPPSHLESPIHFEEEDFYAWINPMYLDMEIQKEIRQKFCSESELELENFMTDEAYKRLSRAFKDEGLAWQLTGPADRQRYEILEPDSMPQDIKECRQFLGCEALFLVLSQLTGLKLHPMAPQDSDEEESRKEPGEESNTRGHVEAQRWGPSCYTLVRDDCVDGCAALDAFLYANVSEQWTQQLGGHVTYITKDKDEELLTVVPRSNCLCLVYRDAQTLKFTKYINASARDLGSDSSYFHDFACVYYE